MWSGPNILAVVALRGKDRERCWVLIHQPMRLFGRTSVARAFAGRLHSSIVYIFFLYFVRGQT